MEVNQLADVFKALGDPTRLKIIALLNQRDCCVCELIPIFNISQHAISKHMNRLKVSDFAWQQSFILEFILTFMFMMVIFGSVVHGKAEKPLAGVAIGGTVGLMAMFAGPICGASMNTSRSIGSATVGDKYEVQSAGLEAHGLNPRVVHVMKKAGIVISHHTSDLIELLRRYANSGTDRCLY